MDSKLDNKYDINQYMYDIQNAFAERTVKRLVVLNALVAIALIVHIVFAHIRKR